MQRWFLTALAKLGLIRDTEELNVGVSCPYGYLDGLEQSGMVPTRSLVLQPSPKEPCFAAVQVPFQNISIYAAKFFVLVLFDACSAAITFARSSGGRF